MTLSPQAQLSLAIKTTSDAFDGDFDKGGEPYIMHCLHVMDVVGKKSNKDHELMAIAVMHDLLEDKPHYNAGSLAAMGFSDRVVIGVVNMTHPKSEPYMDYIARVAKIKDTVIVKMADLDHNSKITRMKGIGPKDLARLEKYHKAYAFLKEAYDDFKCD